MNEPGPKPLLDHPLVEIASRMMRPDGKGGWVFEAQDVPILEGIILQERNDPRIEGAILGLFEVALELYEKHGSIEAAGTLVALLGRLGPKLPLRAGAVDEITGRAKRAMDRFAEFTGGKNRRAFEPAPEAAPGEKALKPSDLLKGEKRKLR
jgi:hypothetical protein